MVKTLITWMIGLLCSSSLVSAGDSPPAFSLDFQPQFKRLTIEQGLSHGVIYSIAQDKQGFMWFGGEGGLAKYDGYTFTVYQHDPLDENSLSNNGISHLLVDRTGAIWCATWGGGVNKFLPETETFIHYRQGPDNSSGLSDDRVQVIYEDQQGIFWFGTFRGGLNRFDPETKTFTVYQNVPGDSSSLSHNRVWSITEDHVGNFWVATSNGLNKLDRTTGRFTQYTHDPNIPDSLSNNQVRWLYVDSAGTLWLSTQKGLNRFHADTETFTHYFHEPDNPLSLSYEQTYKMWEDHQQRLWIGANATDSAGLNLFDRQHDRFIHFAHNTYDPNSISHNDIRAIYEDRSHVLWIGTRGGGVSTLDLKPRKFLAATADSTAPGSLYGNSVNALYEDRHGVLWIGTSGGGLNKYDPKHSRYVRFTPSNSSLNSRTVLAIYEDHTGNLWLGTNDGGLNLFHPETGEFRHFLHNSQTPGSLSDNRVLAVYEDSSGRLWVGTGNGLDLFQPDSETFTSISDFPGAPTALYQHGIFSISESRDGSLWVGTWGAGLYALTFENNGISFTAYQHDPENPASLSNNEVTTVFEDQSEILWIGTRGGLNKYNPQNHSFTRYLEQDGLPGNEIVGILQADDDSLWISTVNGLARLNPQTGTFRNYDYTDGLQSNEFKTGAAYKSPQGEMFFGGVNGFIRFYPEQVRDNPFIPPVVITDFKIFEQSVALSAPLPQLQPLTLSYTDDFFSFEFAALDYTNPQKNRYAYMLEGFDHDWVYSGTRRYASYTNLDPGRYTFKVKGSNDDGVWNETGASIALIITPPFWETAWFRTIGVLCLGSLVLGLYHLRIRVIERQKQVLETQVHERTAELEAQKVELNETLENLTYTQMQLVQSGKLAVLGQLAAGIAHEINTPAGAIVSALSQIDRAYLKLLPQVHTILERLEPALQDQYLAACHHVLTQEKSLSSRERRAIARRIQAFLMQKHIETPYNFCSKLALIGFTAETVQEFSALFQHPERNVITDAWYILGSSRIHIHNAQQAISQITQLVSALKNYAHQDEADLVETDLRQDLDNTLLVLNNAILAKNITVHKEYEEVAPFVCYAAQLNQVWTDLISNAFQAMSGQGTLSVRLKQIDDTQLAVEIEDTGSGIPAETLPHIFEPYFSIRNRDDNHIGMGLSICRKVVEQHRGRIDVISSGPGKTCFRVTLPTNIEYPGYA